MPVNVDSHLVLWGQTIAYTAYAIVIISVVGWFAYRVTRPGADTPVKPGLFYAFVGMLVVLGVSLHLVTYNTIPWVPTDLHREGVQVDRAFDITVADHVFALPAEPMEITCNEMVRFGVTSDDLTYGFGLFRPDESMLFQMQVVPGHPNDVLWEFTEDGTYSIRSTEYSGPEGIDMVVEDAVRVSGCSDIGGDGA
jgi:cytochrome c oxidase subunit 2